MLSRFDRVPWSQFAPRMRDWQQGQHVSLIGPTGCGKTRMLVDLLDARKYVLFFGSKVHDDTYDLLSRKGYKRYSEYGKVPATVNKVMLWPKFGRDTNLRSIYAEQARVFRQAYNAIFHERGWTVVNDELHYICADLGLKEEAAMFHHQGRSSKLTMVNGFQRPANVPLVVYGSSTHVYVWKTSQLDTDAKRLADFGGADRRELLHNLTDLDKHEFIYINPVDQSPPVRSKMDI